jgi:hypothetical protein
MATFSTGISVAKQNALTQPLLHKNALEKHFKFNLSIGRNSTYPNVVNNFLAK